MAVIDGNALAGVLADVLGPDATVTRLRCRGCGSAGVVGRTSVLRSAMGWVGRCRDCDTVLVTVVETPHGRLVGLPGARTVGTPGA
ncbi:hypothetical protein Csp2054_11215 [Curtobacterium sp. 'Ferrero']|uniref:DUF6510 family protein n=1 Tax=Curtobacterium sp. 'Ferrero' TaxID=2033654 RepID=UPI000BC53D53|nr:DUF6510 family protein [Curtobacterium sp. 'Ferrero']PCN47670.1 hypothetical protein Csp2054_11215 [Curtobacterium sp. 'Ferrero']